MSERCNASSMKPLGGGVHYRDKHSQMHSATDGHYCTQPPGHSGPHTKLVMQRLGDRVATRYRYIWDDEHELTCLCDVVQVEPPPPDPMKIVLRVSDSTSTASTITVNL